MFFNAENVGFGRQETFGLRYGWLTKGSKAFIEDPFVFDRDDSTVTLGVGRNMVKSIKYWLQACGILRREKRNDYVLSRVGEYLFGENGCDTYIEDDATLWLLHWCLATNSESATVFYWFFNCYHRTEFDSEKLFTSLSSFLSENLDKSFAEKTIKQDISVLLRMYTYSKGKSDENKELESPFSTLGLLSYFPDERVYRSRLSKKTNIPVGIFGYAVVEFMMAHETREIPIEKMMYSKEGEATLGSIFRLSEEGLMYLLDELIGLSPEVFEFRSSAGLSQLYMLKVVDPFCYLHAHYEVSR